MTDVTRVLDFLAPYESDSDKLQVLKKQYVDLVQKIEEEEAKRADERRSVTCTSVEELQAMVSDYRRDNRELETGLRAMEKARQTLHDLVANLKARISHYESKVQMFKDVLGIDLGEFTAENLPALKKEFGWLKKQREKTKQRKTRRAEPLLDDTSEESPETTSTKVVVTKAGSGDGHSSDDDPFLDEKAKAVLRRHKRESAYLRSECQALEEELRSSEKQFEERIHSHWEREVVALLHDMDSSKLSKWSKAKGRDFVEWTPQTGDDVLDSVQSRLHKQIASVVEMDDDLSDISLGGDCPLAAGKRGSVPLADGLALGGGVDVEAWVREKNSLATQCAAQMEAMRDMLRCFTQDYKYRRLLDRMLDDNKYKKLLDRLADDSDPRDVAERDDVENDLNELLDRIQHLKGRRMSRAQLHAVVSLGVGPGVGGGPTHFSHDAMPIELLTGD